MAAQPDNKSAARRRETGARESERAKAGTFSTLAQRYLDQPRAKGRELRTRGEVERKLKADIPADWNGRPIDDITRAEIRELRCQSNLA